MAITRARGPVFQSRVQTVTLSGRERVHCAVTVAYTLYGKKEERDNCYRGPKDR